jgi:uncharacterized phage protein gp47/JayE
VALANQINLNKASGVFLDAICILTGLERVNPLRAAISDTSMPLYLERHL